MKLKKYKKLSVIAEEKILIMVIFKFKSNINEKVCVVRKIECRDCVEQSMSYLSF